MNQLYQIRADLIHFVVLLALRESFFIACSCLTDISLQNVQTRYGVVARYIVSQTILTLQNLVFHELFLHLLQRKDLAIQSRERFRADLSVKDAFKCELGSDCMPDGEASDHSRRDTNPSDSIWTLRSHLHSTFESCQRIP